MKVLFIGGTGTISAACSKLAIERGIDLYLLNRGTSIRPNPTQATVFSADIRSTTAVRNAIAGHTFDVVVDFLAFTPEHISADIDLFTGITKQYIFISSASAYQTPPRSLPILESTPLHNPFWAYSRQKIACEELLMAEYRSNGFPVTIVRPSHTYDETKLPFFGRWTIIERMRQGLPIIVHGDGTSLWTLTHADDFAKAFVGLLGNRRSIGETFHITSDEALTWYQIFHTLADAANTTANIVHVPSDLIATYDQDWGDGLLGDKAHSMVFDNSKIKRFVPDYCASIPFSSGARNIIAWFEADPSHQVFDDRANTLIETILANYQKAYPD